MPSHNAHNHERLMGLLDRWSSVVPWDTMAKHCNQCLQSVEGVREWKRELRTGGPISAAWDYYRQELRTAAAWRRSYKRLLREVHELQDLVREASPDLAGELGPALLVPGSDPLTTAERAAQVWRVRERLLAGEYRGEDRGAREPWQGITTTKGVGTDRVFEADGVSVVLPMTEAEVLEAFLKAPAMTGPGLEVAVGDGGNAVKLLKRVKAKYPALGKYITVPGGKASGGYSVRIRETTATGER